LVKYTIFAAMLFAILRFVSGRPDWTRAWLFVAIITFAQFGVGIALHRKSPDLLVERSRMQQGTKSWDKLLAPIIAIVGPLAIWVVAALDVRWNWPPSIPSLWSAVAFAICVGGVVLAAWAMLVNRFFAATVRIQSDRGHKLVDRGPYARLRHPGYTGAMAFTLASPIALGSKTALIPAVLTGIVLVIRTALEDRTLQAELPGYKEYTTRVRSRLVPGLW
jgi:protein-S-isoprenylcysteine O-methyltransferase Ste14